MVPGDRGNGRIPFKLCQLRLSDLVANWMDLDYAERVRCSASRGERFSSVFFSLERPDSGQRLNQVLHVCTAASPCYRQALGVVWPLLKQ